MINLYRINEITLKRTVLSDISVSAHTVAYGKACRRAAMLQLQSLCKYLNKQHYLGVTRSFTVMLLAQPREVVFAFVCLTVSRTVDVFK